MSEGGVLLEREPNAVTPEAGRSRWWATLVMGLGALALAASTVALFHGVAAITTFFYFFAWYPTLLLLDGLVAWTGGAGGRGRFLLLDRPAYAANLLGWSAVVWLFYELFNLRLRNWYYVFEPQSLVVRWGGTVLAFATVLPALFLAEALWKNLGVARRVRWRPVRVTPRFLRNMRVVGATLLVLVLAWPRYFFPLVWGATTLLVEPAVYRRARDRSLLGDLERGRPGRILRLLLSGAAIGLLWEMFNIRAHMKWIYTVPFFEGLKLFEMPVPGFFGFPPFAVECFVLWQLLVVAGVAIPVEGRAWAAPWQRRVLAVLGAAVFSVLVLLGMEARTMDSRWPTLEGLPGVSAGPLHQAGYTVFSLAAAAPGAVARAAHTDVAQAGAWVEVAQLAALRGIGTTWLVPLGEVGIHSIQDLAAVDPVTLIRRLRQVTDREVVPARVRVWVRGARRAVARR